MVSRRKFLSSSVLGGAAFALSPRLLSQSQLNYGAIHEPLLQPARGERLITILHTNDVHSQIDPLPANDQYAGKGGVARRATLVKRIRRENPNTLLVDAGDAFQGTPYFNFYRGEVEYKAMSAIGYDVVTLGNHDFDNGVEALAQAMRFANFEFVLSNYDYHGTAIEPRVKRYAVREVGGVRIGLFGMCINLNGLNAPNTFKGLTYLDPVQTSREMIDTLRVRERCALVVAMSHLGYYENPKHGEVGDSQVAAQVDGIDFIASGHTHTFMKKPVVVKQPSGGETLIFQVGKSGIYLGRVDFLMRGNQIASVTGRLLDLRDGSI
ncbi:MAG: hypothetical protein AUG51_23940 [Acidobacteria bacterium 13_1_20CM_3_53_8]|nr:MAG: hypothetical protein AUG51_23940 [Acidobacteria bacterium 13_1_20CM_3_53_8]